MVKPRMRGSFVLIVSAVLSSGCPDSGGSDGSGNSGSADAPLDGPFLLACDNVGGGSVVHNCANFYGSSSGEAGARVSCTANHGTVLSKRCSTEGSVGGCVIPALGTSKPSNVDLSGVPGADLYSVTFYYTGTVAEAKKICHDGGYDYVGIDGKVDKADKPDAGAAGKGAAGKGAAGKGVAGMDSSSGECKFVNTGSDAAINDSYALGNTCDYEISAGGETITEGTCNLHRFADSGPSGAMAPQLGLMGGTQSDAKPWDRFEVNFIVNDGKTRWPDLVGFSYELGGSSNPEYVQGQFAITLSYTRLSSMANASNVSDVNRDPYVDLDCQVHGNKTLDAQLAMDGMTMFDFGITSATEVCNYADVRWFLVHGSLDAVCIGRVGMATDDTPIKVHMTF